ncbi:S66 family peptidase [Pediococcus pentosaceus]|uniref:S66 family peptidase n=1 Tax=Pediococcus pentosaceus TaxID=1255 RepID=UPI0018A16C41|nr:S66 peptidase family protein [Pediococcus pentosaceus]MBF7123457.1 LD-carboxypeptidase [Pediococcus pentosaceus]MCR1861500.1 LD-carboxypeptidase [Pediococcus pentosaceus]
MKKLKALVRGDKVAIVSLSSGVLGESFAEHELKQGIQRLKEFGLQPIIMKNACRGIEYLKCHPEARAADLKQAFMTADIKGIICAIGGDDTYRLVPYLMEDEEFIRAVQAHPKIFTGFSDTTFNHLMLNKLGLITYYGPNLLNDLGELDRQMLPYTRETFASYLKNEIPVEIKSSPIWYDERVDFSIKALNTPRVKHDEKHGYLVLRGKGKVTGRLFGGCLNSLGKCVLGEGHSDQPAIIQKYGLLPEPEKWLGKILFIETSEEKPTPKEYRKLLETLDQFGIISKVSAIIVGKPQDEIYFNEYQKILLEVTTVYQTPIMFNLNFGHAYPRTVIPYNLEVTVDFDERTLTVQESLFN